MNKFSALVKICLWICIIPNVDALNYQKITYDYLTTVHILTVNPQEHKIVPVRALRNGRETVLTIANRSGALAAINGGFWKEDGSPAGVLKIDGRWHSITKKSRGAIGWTKDQQTVLLDRIQTSQLLFQKGSESRIQVTPLLNATALNEKKWNLADHIVGGSPLLLLNKRKITDYQPEQLMRSFIARKYARTAIGIKANGDWLFVVADSSLYHFFGGLSISELADLMIKLDCVHALNLDGGGSTTMVLKNEIINRTAGKIYEKQKYVTAVSDAILIFPAKEF